MSCSILQSVLIQCVIRLTLLFPYMFSLSEIDLLSFIDTVKACKTFMFIQIGTRTYILKAFLYAKITAQTSAFKGSQIFKPRTTTYRNVNSKIIHTCTKKKKPKVSSDYQFEY